jgi:hypothetical protein
VVSHRVHSHFTFKCTSKHPAVSAGLQHLSTVCLENKLRIILVSCYVPSSSVMSASIHQTQSRNTKARVQRLTWGITVIFQSFLRAAFQQTVLPGVGKRCIVLLYLQNQVPGLEPCPNFIDDIMRVSAFFMSCARSHLNGGPGGGIARCAGVDEAGSSNPVWFRHQ